MVDLSKNSHCNFNISVFDNYLEQYIFISLAGMDMAFLNSLIFFYAYPLALLFIYKDRTVVSFDQENLYISNDVSGEEKVIPLEHVTFFKMTLTRVSYYYYRWLLRYDDGFYQKQEVRFFLIKNYKVYQEFITLTKKKNPGFRVENYTF